MKSYYISVWCEEYGKYGYLMSTNNIDSVRDHLKKNYNRFKIEERG